MLTWRRSALVSLGPSKLTSALVPLTPSLGSIFKNSFPKDLSVEIVCARGYFEKIPRPKPPLAGAGLGLGRTLGGLEPGGRQATSQAPAALLLLVGTAVDQPKRYAPPELSGSAGHGRVDGTEPVTHARASVGPVCRPYG